MVTRLDSTVFTNASQYQRNTFLALIFSQSQDGSKLIAFASLNVATLSFPEVDDLPNGIEVLRDHQSVKG